MTPRIELHNLDDADARIVENTAKVLSIQCFRFVGQTSIARDVTPADATRVDISDQLRSDKAAATETVARLSAECDSLRAELATAQQDYGALMAHAINVYGPCTSVYEALDGMAKVADKRVKELEELARQIAGTDSAYDFAVLRGRAFALLSPAKEAEEGE